MERKVLQGFMVKNLSKDYLHIYVKLDNSEIEVKSSRDLWK
jgi:hypothetical protein